MGARRERRSSHRHRGGSKHKLKRKNSERHKHRSALSPKIYEKEEKEPGNDHDDHPLNDLQKKRDSEKLSDLPKDDVDGKKRSFMHLTKKSLEALVRREILLFDECNVCFCVVNYLFFDCLIIM